MIATVRHLLLKKKKEKKRHDDGRPKATVAGLTKSEFLITVLT